MIPMSSIVGIDLGTTNSLVATVDSGLPYVIADADGRRLTPSVVHFPPANAPPVVGEKANRLRALEPASTVYSIKRFMGRRGAEISREEMLVNYPVRGQGAGPVTVALPDRALTPEEISAEILRKLKRDAEAALGQPVTRAVITVPAYFNDAQRNATKKAGELAGFTVERILNEPTAAALAYGLDKLREKSKIAVYDLGGGTFDLSILELTDGVFQVLSTHGNTRLGGDDLDKRLVDFIVDKIKDRRRTRTSPATCPALARVRDAAEAAKIRLSTQEQAAIALPFLAPDFHFDYTLTRAALEDLTRDIIRRTRPHLFALSGRRETRTWRPRSGHPRWRPDPHAAGAAHRRRHLRLRGVRRGARRHPPRRRPSQGGRAAPEHFAKPGRGRRLGRGHPGGRCSRAALKTSFCLTSRRSPSAWKPLAA